MKNSCYQKTFRTQKTKRLLFYVRSILIFALLAAIILIVDYVLNNKTGVGFRTKYYSKLELKLNKQELKLNKGESEKIYVIGINKRVSFHSSDIKVARVDIFGNVYALKKGSAVIRAVTDGKTLKCRVKVE